MPKPTHYDPASDPVRALAQTRPWGPEALGAASDPEATEIAPGIFMSRGTSNAYLVLTEAGRVIINTGLGFEALTHKRNFDAVSKAPTTHILVTQGHVDHVGGVGLFREEGTRFIAQADNEACQADDARIASRRQSQSYVWFADVIDEALRIAESNPDVVVQDAPTPDETYETSFVVETGGRRFELVSVPGGETIDSALIWLPAERTAFVGNVFGPLFPHFPNFNTIRGDRYRDPSRYLESLDSVRALSPEILITGHGHPIEGEALIRACLDRLEAAVRYVHDKTIEGINKGRDIDEIAETLRLPDELYVGQGYGRVSWAVRTFWESYIGWFKLRSTRELYPGVGVNAEVATSLVELAGAEAVLDRARKKLDTAPLVALGLAEAVLARKGGDKDALGVAKRAHERLLSEEDDAKNFWLGGWLRAEIRRIDEALSADPDAEAEATAGEVAALMEGMPERFVPKAAPGLRAVYQYELTGAEGGTWAVIVEDDTCRVERGPHPDPSCRIGMRDRDFLALNYGELHPLRAAMKGKIQFDGDRKVAIHLERIFEKTTRPKNASPRAADNDIYLDDLASPRLTPEQKIIQRLTSLGKGGEIRFDGERVLRAATKRTRLSDFGPRDFETRLELLLEDYRDDTTLSALGKQTVYGDLVRYASNRLLLLDTWGRHPEIDDEEILAPIIVAGLPRSGTTHLVNLLAADSRFRSLPLWESQEPVPNPREGQPGAVRRALFRGLDRAMPAGLRRDLGVDTLDADPRYLRSLGKWAGMRRAVPFVAAMHPMNPDHVHEELELMAPDFASYTFEWTAHVPRFRDHYYATDQTPHYAFMLRALKLLQWQDRQRGIAPKRWVLKCPQHLEQLPALMATFPDATVLFTHRDPVAVVQSSATMLAYSHRMGRTHTDPPAVCAYWAERIERLLRVGVEDRPRVAAERSYDVLFHDFMADTERTLDAIYAVAGEPRTRRSREEQRAFLDAHPRGKNGRVRYDLEGQFGVTKEALRARYGFYFDAYPIRAE